MKPTQKQLDFIELIESYLGYYGVEFNGTTKEDARKFISENIEMFKDEQIKQDAMFDIMDSEYR